MPNSGGSRRGDDVAPWYCDTMAPWQHGDMALKCQTAPGVVSILHCGAVSVRQLCTFPCGYQALYLDIRALSRIRLVYHIGARTFGHWYCAEAIRLK